MGLFSKKNIDKAKAMAEKNKDKIAGGVSKATDAIDKKTGGKHHDRLKKVDDAAKKFAGEGAATTDAAAPGDGDAPAEGAPADGTTA